MTTRLAWRNLLLVFVGGTVGTGARAAIAGVAPGTWDVPLATFAINVAGAFTLGVLVHALAAGSPSDRQRDRVRLLFGTGLLGGFTTYSALAFDTVELLSDGRVAAATSYGIGTVLCGVLAAWAGLASVAWWHRRTAARS